MPLGDTPSENFVKFFTRESALMGAVLVAQGLPGGSPGSGGCSRERSEGVVGGWTRRLVQSARRAGVAAHVVLTTVATTRWFPCSAMTSVTWAAQCSRGLTQACEGAHERPPRTGWILDGMSTTERPRILVVGGGYVGLYA